MTGEVAENAITYTHNEHTHTHTHTRAHARNAHSNYHMTERTHVPRRPCWHECSLFMSRPKTEHASNYAISWFGPKVFQSEDGKVKIGFRADTRKSMILQLQVQGLTILQRCFISQKWHSLLTCGSQWFSNSKSNSLKFLRNNPIA